MNNSCKRSTNCNPFNDETPMNRKTPKSTGIGIKAKIGVIKVDKPIQSPIKMLVTLCSLIPRNCGCSPGAKKGFLASKKIKKASFF